MAFVKKLVQLKPKGNDQILNDNLQLPNLSSIILIQKWFRRYQAQLEVRRRCSWIVYQSLEYSSEQNTLKLRMLFGEFLQIADKPAGAQACLKKPSAQNNADPESVWNLNDHGLPTVSYLYNGPRIRFPLTKADVIEMLNLFRKGRHIHVRYLVMLLAEARRYLKQLPTINSASTSISRQITVVGDLHGSLTDLDTIIFKNGFPDIMNPYVFNGDYVDRGDNSVELMCVLLAMLLANPTSVFLNRGNHEFHLINCRYGFIQEIQKKYKARANRVVQCFTEVFRWLPLATIIDEKVFVCHGGVSSDLCREELNAYQRYKADEKREIQYLHLLWNDPKPDDGYIENRARGGFYAFGPDVTEAFLGKNNFRLVIRSHECKQNGYEWTHGNKMLTIFSVSNYYGDGSNKGAYAVLDHEQNPHIVQFVAPSRDTKSNAMRTAKQKIVSLESLALKSLRAEISSRRRELIRKFKTMDSQNTEHLSVSQWCEAMESVLKLQLPWRTLRPRLVAMGKDGVAYMSTFDACATSALRKSSLATDLAEDIYSHREELEAIFRLIDQDNSGKLSIDEFCGGCKKLGHMHSNSVLTNFSEAELVEMARSLDLDQDGQIDFNEFLEAFRIVDAKSDY